MTQNEIPQLDSKQQELLQRKIAQMEEGEVQSFSDTSNNFHEDMDQPQEAQDQLQQTPLPTATIESKNLKQKIAELEDFLGDTPQAATTTELTFRDSSGDETFYVRNICGMHVILSDLEIDKIPVGKSIDLLRYASLEDLKKSRDLRRCIYGVGNEKTLKRLTEQEFYEDKKREVMNKKKLAIIQQQEQFKLQGQQQNPDLMPHERTVFAQNQKIRGVIEAKLGKLMLRSDSNQENAKYAMQSPEFIAWVQNEPLTHAEIEYIMGHPAVVRDHDIRAALLEKKGQVPPE